MLPVQHFIKNERFVKREWIIVHKGLALMQKKDYIMKYEYVHAMTCGGVSACELSAVWGREYRRF